MNIVRSMTKMRNDNDMTDRTSPLYTKNENKLSWSIGQGAVYHEN